MNSPFQLSDKKELQLLFEQARELPSITVGVVCPETPESLIPVLQATDANIIQPILIGSLKKIKEVIDKGGWHLSKYECIDLDEPDAVWYAIQMVHDGKIQALMKGSLSTHALISSVVDKERGLRVGKRITHIMLMDIPVYKKPLMITDGAFNVSPTLADKKSIVQNAIDFATILDIAVPKVALLSAIANVSEKIPSSIDCDALYKMAMRGEIMGGVVEGPLSFDIALSEKAAVIKNNKSKVAGNPDIVVVPDIDAGNILFKALEHLANARSFGIGVGGKVPIILTSRSASLESRIGSCILTKIYINKCSLDGELRS